VAISQSLKPAQRATSPLATSARAWKRCARPPFFHGLAPAAISQSLKPAQRAISPFSHARQGVEKETPTPPVFPAAWDKKSGKKAVTNYTTPKSLKQEKTRGKFLNMLHFKCPHCRTALQIESHYAGQTVLCPTCNGRILAPFPQSSGKPILCICGQCKALFQVPDKPDKQQVSCPTCGHAAEIPSKDNSVSESQMLRFSCRSCGQSYCIPSRYAGRKFTCPACKHACLVPSLQNTSPKPPSSPEAELFLLFEPKRIQSDQTDELPSTPPQEPAGPPPADEERKSQKSRFRKTAAALIGTVLGFSVAYWAATSLFKSAPEKESPSVQRYPQAVDFSRSIITQLNRKSEKIGELIYLFPDEIEISEPNLLHLLGALDIGRLSSLETAVETARVEPGASFFITKSTAVSDEGTTRIIRIGFVEIENHTDPSFPSIDRYLFGISILDEKDALLASAGQSDPVVLAMSLQKVVDQYRFVSPAPSPKTHTFSEMYQRFVEKYSCPIASVLLLAFLVTLISLWVVFDKAGEPGWAAYIPIYNTVVLARIGGKPEWLGFLCAVSPMVPRFGGLLNLGLFLFLCIGVSKTFGKGTLFGIGLVFLPFIFFPILAFSESAYPQDSA
jgi:DNA-directed RNA polymerase subunit RPC12/RpoP